MLIEITEKTHPVLLDMRYATFNNFTNQIIYNSARCFLLDQALPLFEKAIRLAEKQAYTLKIFDTFRPKAAQEILWKIHPDPQYVTPPEKGSNHSKGIAIDLTLCNQQGQELDMGTPFDSFTIQSHHGAEDITPHACQNRYALLGIMLSAGWDLYKNEWWHYQMFNASSYGLLEEKL